MAENVEQEREEAKLPDAPIFDMYVEEAKANNAKAESEAGGGAPQGMVMEVDASAPKEVQEQEIAEAARLGIPHVIKGGAEPKKEEAAAAAKEAGTAHPLRALREEGEARKATPPTKEVIDYFKANGVENPEEFLSKAPAMAVQMAELTGKLSAAEKELDALERLSPEAKTILTMDLDGENWREKLQGMGSIDVNKPFSRQDQEEVVSRFAKRFGITKDQWEEYNAQDGDPKDKRLVQMALDEAKEGFEKERNNFLEYGKRSSEQVAARRDAWNGSRQKALSVMDGIQGSAAYRDKVSKQLTPEGIRDLFFEKDGATLKPTAAIDLWMILDRDAVLGINAVQANAEAKSNATRELLRRSDERPSFNARGGGGKPNLTGEAVAKKVFADLMGR